MSGEGRGKWAMPPALGARSGATLVEILVALVVLVIGIFSLVRLFPLGFGSILYGEGVTRGTALTRAELERVRAAAANVADGIAPLDPNQGFVDAGLQPGVETLPYPNPPIPGVPPDSRFSDVNRYRRIFGESTKVPAPTSDVPYLPFVNAATGEREAISLYTVQFSPIYSDSRMLVYSGTPLEREVIDTPPSDAEVREIGEGGYGIDYRNAMLYFAPVSYERRFRIDYSFTVPQGGNAFFRANSVPDACIYVAPNVTRFDMRNPPSMPPDCRFIPLPKDAQVEVDEEQVYRAFQRLPPAQAFSTVDPYQFKVLNTLIGIMGLNPLGASPGNRYGAGGRPLTVKMDYDVEDWHILREDRVVPQSGPFNVDLTIPFVKKLESIDESQEQYFGLIKQFPKWPTASDTTHDGTPGIDLVVADLDTGLTLDSLTLQTEPIAAIPSANGNNGRIDYNRGRIEFNPVVQWSLPTGALLPPSSIAGRRIRVYYRSESDWALQVTKAYSRYRREVDPNLLGYGQYVQNGPDLFFPPIDHDQSVTVDYTWVQVSGTEKRVRQESGELLKIKSPAAADSPQTVGRAPDALARAWWTRLKIAGRTDVAADEPVVIQNVRGASVLARALWREGPRWRRLEHSTLLAR